MSFDTKAVPFEIPTVSQGFRIARGLLSLEGEELVLEFQVTDAFLEMFNSDVEEVRLRLADLQSIEYKKSWFSSKVMLEARSLRIFEDIPGTEQAECVLKIKKKDRAEAEKLVSKTRLTISEMRLKEMDE